MSFVQHALGAPSTWQSVLANMRSMDVSTVSFPHLISFLDELSHADRAREIALALPRSGDSLEHVTNLYRRLGMYAIERDLTIAVTVFNRVDSFKRLMELLLRADYMGDRVHLRILIDRSRDGVWNIDVVAYANKLAWPYGIKDVVLQPTNRMPGGQWLDAWPRGAPRTNDEWCVIIEDDLGPSPFFYRWLKAVHKYARESNIPRLAGFSMQRQTYMVAKNRRRMDAKVPPEISPTTAPVYFYRLWGSWGYAPTAEHWRTYVNDTRYYMQHNFSPRVDDLVIQDWADAKLKNTGTFLFDVYVTYHARKYDLFTLYANLPRGETICTCFRERGWNTDQTYGRDFKALSNWTDDLVQFPADHRTIVRLDWDGDPV